ncbi:restriction endonuclease subunit S [Micromonospora aurantiaca (nom. illeg.)]|uniref:restriction endonuclease subunit S n=1 Tax=Micromonospora aurantiaca (nom. illeg.) TaxID=47850 RepID=UPI0016570EDC|nr:restriction endonuclease subunit S [Micromonospora aurantiaca]MBC9001852.1 restriction endonuclease subunit S [Micromonospora aurantiaca]
MSDWQNYALGDVAEVFDGPHATPAKTEEGPWYLSISSLISGRLELSESAHLSEQDFERWTKRVTPTPGDILFSYETRLGEAALMPQGIRAALGRRMGLLRPRRELVEPRFLLLTYLSPEFQQVIQSRKIHGATVDRIPLTELPKWPIRIPDISTQRRISAALGALDEKIVVNDRIATASRQLGEVLYRSALGEESREMTVGEVSVTLARGQAPKYTDEPASIIVLNQKCVRDGRVLLEPSRLTEAARVKPDRILQKYDILVNSTGVGTLGRVGIWSHDVAATADSHVTIIRMAPPIPAIVGGFALLAAQPEIEALGEGSTGQTELSRSKLASLVVPIPTRSLEELAHRLSGLEKRADAALSESRTLTELRDTLLPELMSGRLRVKDAEKIVEETV